MTRSRRLLAAATLLASVATAGSLWFSLGLGLVPCTLCWYQRILMYPLVVVGGVAAVEDRVGAWRTILPLALGGTLVAASHVYVQLTPVQSGACGIDESCAAIQYPMLGGLLTIPRLSLVAFVLVSVLTLALAVAERRETATAWE